MEQRIAHSISGVAAASRAVVTAWLMGTVVLLCALAMIPWRGAPWIRASFGTGVVVASIGVVVAMIALAVAAQSARAALGQPWTAPQPLVVAGALTFPFLVPAVVLFSFEKRLFLYRGEALPSYSLSAILGAPLLLGFPCFIGVAAGAAPPDLVFLVLWSAFAATRIAFVLRLRALCLDAAARAVADDARAVYAGFAAEPG